MPRAIPLIRIGFNLGVKSSYDPSSIPVNALWRARDVVCDISGILRIRPDATLFGANLGSGKIQGTIEAFDGILQVWNQNVYITNPDGVSRKIADPLIGTTAADLVEITRWSRAGAEIAYLFAGNGIFQATPDAVALVTPYSPATGEKLNLIRKEDGTQNLDSGPARCRYAILKASLSQRLVLAGDPESPNTVYLSAPLDGTYFASDQIIQLPDDGAVITGLANWYNALVIFRDRDVWAFFGSSATDSSASLVLQCAAVGCVSGRTIANVPTIGLAFLAQDNVYALKGVTAVENQLEPIPLGNDIRIQLLAAMGYGLDHVSAVYYNREYRLSFPHAIVADRVFRLSLQTAEGWYIDSGPLTAQFVVAKGELYGVDRSNGQLLKFQKEFDETQRTKVFVSFRREDLQPGPARIKKIYIYTAIQGLIRPTELSFFGPDFNEKRYGEMDRDTVSLVTGTNQTLKITAFVDGNEITVDDVTVYIQRATSPQLSISEPVRIYEARFSPSLKGHFIQLQVQSVVPGENVAILGYGVEYSNREKIHGIKAGDKV